MRPFLSCLVAALIVPLTSSAQAPKQVEVINLPEIQAVEIFNPSVVSGEPRLITSADGVSIVPAGKVWKIVNVNGGAGTVPSGPPIRNSCGGKCAGGTCDVSSCSYAGFLIELNGVPIGPVKGCAICPGSTCSPGIGTIAGCPAATDIAIDEMAVELRTPFWLPSGASLRINVTNTFVSILEFDAIGVP